MHRAVLAVGAALALSACTAGTAHSDTALPTALRPSAEAAGGVTVLGPRPSKVMLVVAENRSQAAALSGMPQLRRLATRYGRTTRYRAITHPSLPNYLALAGGSTFGVRDDADPSAHQIAGGSVFDQALRAGRTAKTYAESMPRRCATVSAGRYAVKHNPWPYFSGRRERADCRRYDVPMGSTTGGALHRDIRRGRLPTVGMMVPNLCDDAHDCPLATADSWLHRWFDVLRHGPDWTSGRLAVVVTFDENDGTAPNTVLTVVLSPRIRHVVARSRYTHYSWTRYADSLIGARPLRHAAGSRSLGTGFGL